MSNLARVHVHPKGILTGDCLPAFSAADALAGSRPSKGIPDEAMHAVREACNDMAASRRLLVMNGGGLIEGGLDEVVFSTDADEFLFEIHAAECTARVVVIPAFLHAEQLQDLPGVSHRAMVYVSAA
jgi:hypothetical protein